MNFFVNLSIKYKLLLQISIITFTVIVLFLFSKANFETVEQNQSVIADKYSKALFNLEFLKDNIHKIKDETASYILFRQGLAQADLDKSLFEAMNSVESHQAELERLLGDEARYQYNLNQLQEDTRQYFALTRKQIDSMKINPRINVLYTEAGSFMIQDILVGTKKLSDNLKSDIDNLLRKSANDIFKGVVTFWVLLGVTIIVSILIFFQSIGMITAPLKRIADVSNSIADGDLNIEIPEEKREDEIGLLVGSYKRMIQSLRDVSSFAANIAAGDLSKNLTPRSANDEMINSLNKMSTALRSIIGGTQEGIKVLSTTSGQIFSGTAQLATSSNETATAITETTATIEEVKKTSEISSRKSREVSVVAQQATEISEKGMMATENTIDGIHRIGGQMKTIGLSIDRLTEQSKAIGEIIATVNDLAEQSNLLAVNASIEAARAGEQGKIFVVVAQEIKSLSEQSKQATAQVKTVLNDVQSAIQASVIATGEGEKIVSEAVQLSAEAQKAIAKLAETINVFNDAALQTSVASQEQFVGMDQVAIAMENIKSASIQNVRTTKELEEAAKSLLSLAGKLSDINAVFTVR
ncbi:MAG: methyl-accepting chemotaxis protein [Ignavibacteriales bacterium]|nr:hypothetical protein [Ignavibacteriaceae bacterium]MCK6614968.1 methyl-accepting chemotaxis protein [Ignavibacteriaceae bacterium]QOJ29943.1 MAG: methyl-accepting chemotaxis protein [Ignavibacteriales bacterium]